MFTFKELKLLTCKIENHIKHKKGGNKVDRSKLIENANCYVQRADLFENHFDKSLILQFSKFILMIVNQIWNQCIVLDCLIGF